jgi:hypothetical protein
MRRPLNITIRTTLVALLLTHLSLYAPPAARAQDASTKKVVAPSFEGDGSALSRRASNEATQEFFAGAGGQLLDSGGGVFNVRANPFGAKGNGTADDAGAINAAINAAVAAGKGTVYVPTGTYLLGTSVVIPKSIRFIGAGREATVLKLSASPATDALVVRPAATGSWNVISGLLLEGFSIVPASNRAGRYGIHLDTNNALTQIRDSVVRDVNVGSPTAEFGSFGLAVTNNHDNGVFTNTFANSWIYGGVYIIGGGDSLKFDADTVTSNVADRPSFDVSLRNGSTGPLFISVNATGGGGAVIRKAISPTWVGGIFELANTSLTAGATLAVIDLKGASGDPIVGATFLATTIVATNGVVKDGIRNGYTKGTQIGPLVWNMAAGSYLWRATANALETSSFGRQTLLPGSATVGYLDEGDPTFNSAATIFKNGLFMQEGYFGATQQIHAGVAFGFGANKPQMLHGAGSPQGVQAACVGSTWAREDGGAGTSFYIKESGACTSRGWTAK